MMKKGFPVRRRPPRQAGQAIVLVALTLTVLIGMLGLAIDGGRAYVDRRELQNAVDAAVLGAGDNYLLQSDVVIAGNTAARFYALNEHIGNWNSFTSTSSTCPSSFPAGSTCTDFTWSGYGGDFNFGYWKNSFNGTIFSGAATHQVFVAFMQVLGVSSINNFSATAQAIVGNNWQTPALLTLGQQGCNGNPGASLKIQGAVSVTITGDVYSNGNVIDQNGAPVNVNGSAYANCGALPAGWTVSGTVKIPGSPVLGDPAYTSPYQKQFYAADTTTPQPSAGVEMKPGVYQSNPQFTNSSSCHFLDPGIYSWPFGYTSDGGMVSNELRPPAEPVSTDFTAKASPQFWNQSVSCAGDFYATAVTATGGKPLKPGGAWGIEVSAVRQDTWSGPNQTGTHVRQSAPSMCHTLTVPMDSTSHGMQVVIGNVPGAQGYYVYANPAGCAVNNQSAFGFIGYVPNPIAEQNNGSGCGDPTKLPGYPSTPPAPGAGNIATSGASYNGCNLGWVASEIFDNNSAGIQGQGYVGFNAGGNTQWGPVSPQCVIPPTNPATPYLPTPQGCNPPDGEQAPAASGLANDTPPRAVSPNGDRADENQCRPQGSGANPCSGATLTPGAVQFYFPPSACLTQHGLGSTYVFSGYQYNWIVVFAPGNTSPPSPPTPNSCSGNILNGSSATTFIGSIYLPTGSITINGSNRAPVAGQVIAYNALIDGSAGVAISYNPATAPAPPAARLTL